MIRMSRVAGFAVLVFGISGFYSHAQQAPAPGSTPPAQTAEKVPSMDGGAGPCALDLTLVGPDAKPVYAAIVKVHIAYGFAGIRRLDLEAGTNSEGRVKFTGLPARVHRPPLEFIATKDDLFGMATYNPESECEASHKIMLQKTKPPGTQ
jgi:hypothetical protein